jgi:hypothetical protein
LLGVKLLEHHVTGRLYTVKSLRATLSAEILLLGIIIFKEHTARRIYESFGVKGLMKFLRRPSMAPRRGFNAHRIALSCTAVQNLVNFLLSLEQTASGVSHRNYPRSRRRGANQSSRETAKSFLGISHPLEISDI